MHSVVVTGLGLVTPLGMAAGEILTAMAQGRSAATAPAGFDPGPFACRVCAPVSAFDAESYVPDPKTVRLMNRDALLAVAAARRAMQDARVDVGRDYPADRVGLFGATGMAGIPLEEIRPLIEHSADPTGGLDLHRFGAAALRRVRPVLTFKILSNMPICFVSIFEGICGPNSVHTPWEGNGAQAILAGVRAIEAGRVDCALVGGCDVRTHLLAFIALQQHGLFDSWKQHGSGLVPAEGAVFLILEEEGRARQRSAHIYARFAGWSLRTTRPGVDLADTYRKVLAPLSTGQAGTILSADDGDPRIALAEARALQHLGLEGCKRISPKRQVGNLFAAAAALQVALGAYVAGRAGPGTRVVADCFGCGSQQAALALEAA